MSKMLSRGGLRVPTGFGKVRTLVNLRAWILTPEFAAGLEISAQTFPESEGRLTTLPYFPFLSLRCSHNDVPGGALVPSEL